MDTLEIYRNGIRLAVHRLGTAPLEIGRASGCDIVLDASGIAPRHWLALRRHGVVVLHDVSRTRRRGFREQPLPSNRSFALGTEHEVRWVPLGDGVVSRAEPHTDAIVRVREAAPQLVVTVGQGPSLRRIPIGEEPLHVGRAAHSDLVFKDAAVSHDHLRLEPCEAGLVVRDLGSRNGTFVNGVRVQLAIVQPGAQVRFGGSELRVVSAAARTGGGDGPTIVAESSSMLHVLGDVQRMAQLPWPVLVTGESGTGKEGIAFALHRAGPRTHHPFVAVNAGGLPGELVESELFGHERGAFTGAAAAHKGVFEQADRGTLFLDEIGELPPALQARLLRVIESGEIRRVGAEATKTVDVRLVCATHRDLRAMVQQGTFRQDLYFRIARLVVPVPALRSRPDDVRALCRHFLAEIAGQVGVHELSEDALGLLTAYDWPGNVRELRNVLCAAAATAGVRIEAEDVARELQRISGRPAPACFDESVLRRALEAHAGNHAAAARALGMARSTFRDRLRACKQSAA